MSPENLQKITADRLKKDAYLYVRQSTIRQVIENTESTKRQYALRNRAIALGWKLEQIIVIDNDQGKSGAETDREGFQRLVADVGMGRVGIVLGLEVSRLARNSMDWYRLLEICALTSTLILDEEGIYDPAHFNDRLLLGLKGTMSEAELHVIRARLQGGILNKAKRGELKMRLPCGFVYDQNNQVKLDPDRQIQETIKLFFKTFNKVGSACATVKYFRNNKIKFPKKLHKGPRKGELIWTELTHSRTLQILHNPRYAGAFAFGKSNRIKDIDGKAKVRKVAKKDWGIFIPAVHESYISLEAYEANLQKLKENAQAYGIDNRKSPPREGSALLQGLTICGICGLRMTVRYAPFKGSLAPHYMCQRKGIEAGGASICQAIPGASIEEYISKIILNSISPENLDIALSVENELSERYEESVNQLAQTVERTKFTADSARHRFMQVNPDNRLVADTLEAEWNKALSLYHESQEIYEKQKKHLHRTLKDVQLKKIEKLTNNFPKLWNDHSISNKDRKQLVRLIIEDVTLIKKEGIILKIRFKGGALQTHSLPGVKQSWELWQTDPNIVRLIDELLEENTDAQVAQELNRQGYKSGKEHSFNSSIIARLRRVYHLKSCYEHLREKGMFTAEEIASQLNITISTVKSWRRKGYLRAKAYNNRCGYLYEPLGENSPIKGTWKTRTKAK